MREIKFRLYDNQEKKMIFTGFHVFGEVTLFSAIDQYCHETKGDRNGLERYNDFELMQFTGKILNGVEVYEGDIIEFDRREWGGEDNIFIVEWDNDDCAWSFGGGGGKGDDEWRKVIGNIHEQPELLN